MDKYLLFLRDCKKNILGVKGLGVAYNTETQSSVTSTFFWFICYLECYTN